MSKPERNTPRRPVGGSRPRASAPKKIAGRSGQPSLSTPPSEPAPQSASPQSAPPTPPAPPEPTYVIDPGAGGEPGVLSRPGTTRVLAVVLAVLLAALAVVVGFVQDDEGGWYGLGDETGSSADVWRYDSTEDFDLPDAPVQVPWVDARNAADAATQAVVDILTVKWQTYDDHLAAVKPRMTAQFGKQYAELAADTRDKFLSSKAEYRWEVVGQSVVSASDTEVTALLFLNQYVYKGAGPDRTGPEIHQVRVIVTAVADGDEWKIDQLDAL